MKKERKPHIDLLRLYAIGCVIFIHTGYEGYGLFLKAWGTLHWAYMATSIISKAAVPLFFTISGAVLLGRDEPIGTVWKKRILDYAICLVFISMFYFLIKFSEGREVKEFAFHLLKGDISSHLWFMYAYLAFLIVLPYMRIAAQGIGKKEFYYLYAAAFITGPVLGLLQELLLGETILEEHLRLSFVRTSYLFYPILGYYLENKATGKERKAVLLTTMMLSAISVWAVSLATEGLIREGAETIRSSEKYFGMASFALVPFMYTGTSFLAERLPGWAKKTVAILGPSVMGVYLFHIYVMRHTACKYWIEGMKAYLGNDMAACLAACMLVEAVCLAIATPAWLVFKGMTK